LLGDAGVDELADARPTEVTRDPADHASGGGRPGTDRTGDQVKSGVSKGYCWRFLLTVGSGLLRRESHNGVTAEGRDPALANPRPHVPALVSYGARRRAAVIHPPIHKHLHTRQVGKQPLEVLVERGVVSVHDDEQLGIRKRSRWKGLEELFFVARADAVRRSRVFQWFPLTEVAGLAVAFAPG